MKTYGGREATALAILTMCLGNKEVEKKVLERLDGDMLTVAKKIIDPDFPCSDDLALTAKRFIEWRDSMKK